MKNHKSYLKISFAVLLCVLALFGLSGCKRECEVDISAPGVHAVSDKWEFMVDESVNETVDGMSLAEASTSDAWRMWSEDEGFTLRSKANCLWYRRRLPAESYSDPAIFFEGGIFRTMQVYMHGEKVFQTEDYGPFLSRYMFENWYIVHLPQASEGNYVYLKVCSQPDTFIGMYSEMILYGSGTSIYSYLLRFSMPTLFAGLFLIITGLYLVFFSLMRRQSKYIAFSMGAMMLCYGMFSVSNSGLLQLYFDNPVVLWYLKMVSFMLFPVGLWRYVEHLLGAGYVKMVRRFWQFHLLMTILVVAIDMMGQHVAMFFIFMGVTAALCIENVSVLYMVAKNLTRKDRNFRWLIVGLLILNITGILEVLDVFDMVGSLNDYWFFREIFSVGLLIFVDILVIIQERMFRDNELQLKANAAELSRYSGQLEDIVQERTSELVAAKEKAEAADRAKGDFLAHMSHELRTPLNAILGYAQLFRKDETLSDDQRAKVDVVYESGEHLLGMINDVLDLSKIEAGEITLNNSCVDLRRLLKQIEDMVRFKAESKGLMLACDFDEDLPAFIECDSKRLKQILLNVLGNAVKYTENGRIRWRAEVKGYEGARCCLAFAIEDTGAGIAGEDLEAIFDPFHRAHATQQVDGSGLGLAICRNLLQKMGSELFVESSVNEGSRFSFELVVSDQGDSNCSVVIADEDEQTLDGEGVRILIVDDHVENLEVLASMLKPYGFEVATATTGEDAVELVKNKMPDIILMDLLMPNLDGFQTTDVIRYECKDRDLKIIAVSASVHESVKDKALMHGFDAFLPKPVVFDDLLSLVKSFLTGKNRRNIQKSVEISEKSQKTAENDQKTAPDAEKCQKLLEITKTGDVSLILEEIDTFDAEFPEFAAKCRQMAENFQLKQLERFLCA